MLLNECQGDYVIFSVEQVNGENNDRNNKEVRSVFSKENINYKELQGCYKGVEEVSYILGGELRGGAKVSISSRGFWITLKSAWILSPDLW